MNVVGSDTMQALEQRDNQPSAGPAPPGGAEASQPAWPSDAIIVVPVRNVVLFPGMVMPVTIGRPRSLLAA